MTASSPQAMLHAKFQSELCALLNKHGLDSQSNTPDFVLAGMMTEHYETYRKVQSFMSNRKGAKLPEVRT